MCCIICLEQQLGAYSIPFFCVLKRTMLKWVANEEQVFKGWLHLLRCSILKVLYPWNLSVGFSFFYSCT
jgi:hypothetical protein